MPKLDEIREAIARHVPERFPPSRSNAAVAVIVAPDRAGTRLLLIRRAEREGDPWSGHLSFPGGKLDPADAGLREAAERETHEEVGLDLSRAERIGQLDDLRGVAVPINVSAFVYAVADVVPLETSDEVREAFWVPLDQLLDSRRHVTDTFEYQGNALDLPAIELGDEGGPPLWGLTYHFLEQFFALVGRRIPATPWREDL